MSEGKAVYAAITRVTEALAKVGIGKDRRNEDQKFNFRGIDDVYDALAPILATQKLCILPYVQERTVEARKTASGKDTYNVAVKVDYAFVSSEDGSTHIVRSVGEANDQQDKATNKAMSAAYKYACFQAFCIPLEGQDADAEQRESAWDGKVADFLAAIEASESPEEGKKVYKAAIAACKEHKDVRAAEQIKAALLKKFPVDEKAPA